MSRTEEPGLDTSQRSELFSPPFPSTIEVGRRIRVARKRRGWTIAEMAEAGGIKAVVIGSYERGARNMPLSRLGEIAAILNVDVRYLLGEPHLAPQSHSTLMLDLRALSQPSQNRSELQSAVINFSTGIVKARSDWNGEVLSLRKSDLDSLSYATATSRSELLNWLTANEYLITGIDRS